MKKALLYSVAGLLLSATAVAQNKTAIKFSQTINKDNAYKHLSVLASDEYEGRETGTPGGWKAADYIREHFRAAGLKGPVSGGYFQPVDMAKFELSQVLTVDGDPAEPLKDFYVNPQIVLPKGFTLSVPSVLFGGYGLVKEGYDDFQGNEISGKVVMILKSRPSGEQGGEALPALNARLKYLAAHQAAAVLVVDPQVDDMPDNLKRYLQSEQLVMKSKEYLEALNTTQPMPVINIGSAIADKILGVSGSGLAALRAKLAEGKTAATEVRVPLSICAGKRENKVRAENVLGFLEGSDPKLKHEVLVITGHYDHIGINPGAKGDDKINNGADDDGSGTTGVLMIAEAFAKAKKAGYGPKRSILFMTVTGEEKGLLGSEWYSENPVFPLEKTITNLNIDMIGRGDKDHATDNNFVYIIGSDMLSSDLDRIGKKANKDYVNIKLDEKYNNRTDPNRFYYRSDHYNFAKHGIPVIFYFNGVHEDYHQPGDEVSKIDFPMLAKRTRLVYFTAWELANAAKRPAVDKNEDGSPKK